MNLWEGCVRLEVRTLEGAGQGGDGGCVVEEVRECWWWRGGRGTECRWGRVAGDERTGR
jgi:hypothetical protein